MRVNIYAEEITDQVEIISKDIDGQKFTGLRFYLHLPVTVNGEQVQGPFLHHPGDDDSSAVTFWGKRSMRNLLRKALAMLDRHYGEHASNNDEAAIDAIAVARFTTAMYNKLAQKREEGRSGWHDPSTCSIDRLFCMLDEHVRKCIPRTPYDPIDHHQLIDVANLAMFLWHRMMFPTEHSCLAPRMARLAGRNSGRFQKKPITVSAAQWFKNGDHPEDDCHEVHESADGRQGGGTFLSEGKVVRYFRRPDVPGERLCEHCQKAMHAHGWIDTLEGGHIVCPGDWIITGIKGERYPCKPDIFLETYMAVGAAHEA